MNNFLDWLALIPSKAWGNFQNADFVAGEVTSFAFVAAASAFATLGLSWFADRKFKGWMLEVAGHEEAAQTLYEDDVRRYLASDIELWKMVKGVGSGGYDIKLATGLKAIGTWLRVNQKSRVIEIDLEHAVSLGHATRRHAASRVPVAKGKVFFVTRHTGAARWAQLENLTFDEIIPHLDLSQTKIEAGDEVWGILPLHIAAEICKCGARYRHLDIAQTEATRGRDLTAEDMKTLNAKLEYYNILRSS